MKTKGFTRTELILTSLGLIALAALLFFGVSDARRRSRDANRISILRQIEFDLTEYRNLHAAFPDSMETLYGSAAVSGYTYKALPVGCQNGGAILCSSYRISFSLEGRVGTLPGGACESSPEGITCIEEHVLP